MESLQQSSNLPVHLFKNRNEMLTMYEEFSRSMPLASLTQRWVWLHFRHLVLRAGCLEDLLILETSAARRPKLLDLLQREFERALRAPFLDVPFCSKLSLLANDIAAVRVTLST
jgi:hypothetical protein